MNKAFYALCLAALAAALLFAGCGCGDDDDDNDSGDDDSAFDDDSGDDDDDASDDDTADDDTGDDDDPRIKWDLTMTLEYRNSAHMVLETKGDELTATLSGNGDGPGSEWLPAGRPFFGTGKILSFPEAAFQIYSVQFKAQSIDGGPCGDQPVTMELTLTGQSIAAERQGGIACYCGTDSTGRPQSILRIQTKFPLEG